MKVIYTADIKHDLDATEAVLDRFLALHAYWVEIEPLNHDNEPSSSSAADRMTPSEDVRSSEQHGSTLTSKDDSRATDPISSENRGTANRKRDEFPARASAKETIYLSKLMTKMKETVSGIFSFFSK